MADVPLENIERNQKRPESLDEEDFFWDKVLLGSQKAVPRCETHRDRNQTASISSVLSPSPVDTHTPSELRDICFIEDTFRLTPPPPPRAGPLSRGRMSRLPVFSAKLSGTDKGVADGFRLQSAKNKIEAIEEKLQHLKLNYVASPLPPTTPKMTPAMAPKKHSEVPPLAPTPPTVSKTKKRATGPGLVLHRAEGVSEAGRKAASDRRLQAANDKKLKKIELQPLTNPMESLSACLEPLPSDDWMQKINDLKTIQALAQHHSKTLKPKLHEVCLVVIEQVNNLRSAVACAAMNTLAELYVNMQKAMDPEVEGTGRVLLLKLAQTTNAFIHQQTNLALDAMVENCSHGRIVSTLLNVGLNHRSVTVRGSTAQHLHQLADRLTAAHILTAGRSFTERFLIAVSKMCVDAAPEVRHHGKILLQELALNKDFLTLWTKIVPEKERRSLDKIFKKAKL
ncbi:TOG array regulator of axonemal microtubules protein 2-like [Centropristis striata]|uniref:TOG array regulator of axonemal microtubules protein 2-like n=1 Tax=Centropristis striata TaxID=184440 RepID=UPI0027DFAAF6|nr:TOG array regulator of axonemal microtubules protein 2-like [Centropristis striata]